MMSSRQVMRVGKWLLAVLCALHIPSTGRLALAADSSRTAGHEAGDMVVPFSAPEDFHAFDTWQAELIGELLERNPEILAARNRWVAARERIAQQGALPDPMIQLRYFAETPETRVGPQRAGLSVHQDVPWFGKRALQVRQATHLSNESAWDVVSVSRDRVAALKRLYFEAAYHLEALAINQEEVGLLQRFEKIALTRYSTGQGIQQSVIKVQTEITRLLDQEVRLQARLDRVVREVNRLVGLGFDWVVPGHIVLDSEAIALDTEALLQVAVDARPELRAVEEEIEAGYAGSRRMGLENRPDFRFGLEFIEVGHREDTAGLVSPPEDNGQDVVALVASIRVPLQRKRIRAGLAEAEARVASSEGRLQSVRDRVRFEIEEAELRLETVEERARLFDGFLLPQAREALASAEAAYMNGRVDFLALLDAERVLFEARRSLYRLRADFWIAAADLEQALGRPFPSLEDAS